MAKKSGKEQKTHVSRKPGTPRIARSFAKYVREEKSRIRRVTADPKEQTQQIDQLLAGLTYRENQDIQGTSSDSEEAAA